MKTTPAKLEDLTPDDQNANQGTERGNWALTQSLERAGLGRSILIDKDGRIIAGNKTHAKAGELGFEDVLIVPTDGKTLVAVQRTDISLDSPEGRELAIADNRASELNLSWDAAELMQLQEDGQIILSDWWTGDELDVLAGEEDPRGNGEKSNSGEIDPDGFDLKHKCPKCGFEYG